MVEGGQRSKGAQKLTDDKSLKRNMDDDVMCKRALRFAFLMPLLTFPSPLSAILIVNGNILRSRFSLPDLACSLLLFTHCGRTLMAHDARNSHASSRI